VRDESFASELTMSDFYVTPSNPTRRCTLPIFNFDLLWSNF